MRPALGVELESVPDRAEPQTPRPALPRNLAWGVDFVDAEFAARRGHFDNGGGLLARRAGAFVHCAGWCYTGDVACHLPLVCPMPDHVRCLEAFAAELARPTVWAHAAVRRQLCWLDNVGLVATLQMAPRPLGLVCLRLCSPGAWLPSLEACAELGLVDCAPSSLRVEGRLELTCAGDEAVVLSGWLGRAWPALELGAAPVALHELEVSIPARVLWTAAAVEVFGAG